MTRNMSKALPFGLREGPRAHRKQPVAVVELLD